MEILRASKFWKLPAQLASTDFSQSFTPEVESNQAPKFLTESAGSRGLPSMLIGNLQPFLEHITQTRWTQSFEEWAWVCIWTSNPWHQWDSCSTFQSKARVCPLILGLRASILYSTNASKSQVFMTSLMHLVVVIPATKSQIIAYNAGFWDTETPQFLTIAIKPAFCISPSTTQTIHYH